MSPDSTGMLALGLQRGHQAVWGREGDQLCRQRWLRGSPLLPTPAAASPQLPALGSPGFRAARASQIPKNLRYAATLPHAKGCSFPQRLRAAPARLGGLCPMGGTPQPQPPAAWGRCSWISAPKLLGAVGSRNHHRSPRPPNSPCPTAPPDRPAVAPVVLRASVAQPAPL